MAYPAKEMFGHPLRGADPALEEQSRYTAPEDIAQKHAAFEKAMIESGEETFSGNVQVDINQPFRSPGSSYNAPLLRKSQSRHADVDRLTRGLDPAIAEMVKGNLAKEWTTTFPDSTGLVPYDLEAPAKLLAPRPTPLRNTIPRVPGQGAVRRFKVVNGFSGTGTGNQTTINPFINESTQNTTLGQTLVRPPQINYNAYDVNLAYVSWGLTDVVSWQAQYEGQGFQDIRSLSNTALLYSTMLMDERLICYGRGITSNGYAGVLGVAPTFTLSAVSASVTPGGTSTLGTSASVFVVVAADAGDLLSVSGTQMHQGPASNVVTSVGTSTGLTAVQVTITNDSSQTGALGYNLYAASVAGGPYIYAGRTGYSTGYVTSQPTSGPTITVGAADNSALTNSFDGLLTNVAASGGYVSRLNAALSTTNPGVEFQTALASLYESVKADPEQIWLNGFDRQQLSNAIVNNSANSAYRIFVPSGTGGQSGIATGVVVQTVINETTGKALDVLVHPWFPQGNALIRSVELPMPDTNISQTSVMAMVQDYVAVQWPVVQMTYDASTFEIGTLANYAPQYSAIISGIQGVGIGVKPPSYGDS